MAEYTVKLNGHVHKILQILVCLIKCDEIDGNKYEWLHCARCMRLSIIYFFFQQLSQCFWLYDKKDKSKIEKVSSVFISKARTYL